MTQQGPGMTAVRVDSLQPGDTFYSDEERGWLTVYGVAVRGPHTHLLLRWASTEDILKAVGVRDPASLHAAGRA
jgi:hypothetical protein